MHKLVHHYLLRATGGRLTIEGDPDHEAVDVAWVPLGDLGGTAGLPERAPDRARGDGEAGGQRVNRRWRCWPAPAGVLLVTSLVSVGLVAGPAAGAAPATGPPAARRAAADPLPLSVQLTAVRPAALTPTGELMITGRVRNTSDQAAADLRVGLRLQPDRLTTRQQVQAWSAAAPLDEAGVVTGADREVGRLGPGRSASFRLAVPAATLGLPTIAELFGPYGVAVEVTGAGGERLGIARTSVVWYPGRAFRPTRLSLLVPVVARQGSRSVAEPSARLDAELRAGGRLDRVLRSASAGGVAWAVDPALLLGAHRTATGERPGGATTAPDASATPGASPSPTVHAAGTAAARTWLERFRAGRVGRSVTALPFADPDVTALAYRQGITLLRRTDALGRQATQTVLDGPLDDTLAVPVGGAADAAALATLARLGRTAVVLGEQFSPPQPALGYTASGLSRIRTRQGELTGLLADPTLSAQLTAVGTAGSAAATQQLLAELAAVTLERPSDPRHLLAVTSRQWNPDPGRVAAALTALRSAPWVQLRPLQDLRGANGLAAPRQAPLYPASARSAELSRAHVAEVADADRRLTRFASALREPDGVLRPLREQVASLLSVAWRGQGGAATAAREPLLRDVAALYGGVGVVEGGPYNLLTGSGELPVRVRNQLPYPVALQVRLQPRSGQLAADRAVRVELGAGASRLVLVPTRAVANGNVDVDALLLSPDGVAVGQPTRMQVRVRRNWESRGILVLGGLLALLLATGLFRSVRRGRTRVPAGSVPDVDEQALGRARAAAAPPSGPRPPPGGSAMPGPTASQDRAPATALDVTRPDRTPVPDLGPPGGPRS